MKTRRSLAVVLLAGFGAVALCTPAWAATITFSTYASNLVVGTQPIPKDPGGSGQPFSSAWGWNYTGNHSDPMRTVYHGDITTNAALLNAACVGAGGQCDSNDSGNYHGFEFLYFSFDLPADATNIVLHAAFFDADDRMVLSLNDSQLQAYKYYFREATTPGTAPMAYGWSASSGLQSTPVGFLPYGFATPLIWTGPWVVGGENYLRFWLNNTNAGCCNIGAPAVGHIPGDPSALYAYGWISYDESTAPVPEPASLLLFGTGLAGLRAWRRRRE